MAHSDQ